MSVLTRALAFSRVRDNEPSIRLLRSPHAGLVLALVSEYFGGSARPMPAGDVYARMAQDFKTLRSRNFDVPKAPEEYCNDWVKAGWLERKSGTTGSGETLEPTENALSALDAMSKWESPRSTITASRIESIANSLERLATESDPEIVSRLARLERERDALDRQIEAVGRGEFETLTDTQMSERVGDILDIASAVPTDFARVRKDLENLNRSLRRELLEQEGSRGDVLDLIFQGVDVISESDAGRSFDGFYSLLLDPEGSERAEDHISTVLDREAAANLPSDVRRSLRRLFADMDEAGAEVSREISGLARSLRHYVTSGEFAEDRKLMELLRATRAAAARASRDAEIGAITQMKTPLQRIGMSVRSVSAINLSNPGEEIVEKTPRAVKSVEQDAEELLALVRESEIDFAELTSNVRRALDRDDGGEVSVAHVLRRDPATQGLASVVGLLYLAMRQGQPASTEQSETVEWDISVESGVEADGERTERRTARIPAFVFTRDSLSGPDFGMIVSASGSIGGQRYAEAGGRGE